MSLDEQMRRSREMVKEGIAFAKQSVKGGADLRAAITLYSGGNDSGVLAHFTRLISSHVAHCNTGTGIPECYDHIGRTIRFLDVENKWVEEKPLDVDSYETMVMKVGFPGPAHHNEAYRRLKERGLRRIRRKFIEDGRKQRVIFYAGIRAAESKRRMNRDSYIDREDSVVWVSPIYYWLDEDMDEYRERYNLPWNPCSEKIHISGECLCGAFSRPGELEEIRFWYPDVAKRIDALQDQARAAGVKHCVWGGPRKNLPKNIPAPGPLCVGCEFASEKIHGDLEF